MPRENSVDNSSINLISVLHLFWLCPRGTKPSMPEMNLKHTHPAFPQSQSPETWGRPGQTCPFGQGSQDCAKWGAWNPSPIKPPPFSSHEERSGHAGSFWSGWCSFAIHWHHAGKSTDANTDQTGFAAGKKFTAWCSEVFALSVCSIICFQTSLSMRCSVAWKPARRKLL